VCGWLQRQTDPIQHIFRWAPLEYLPLEVYRPFALCVVGQVFQLAQVSVLGSPLRSQKEIDRVLQFVVFDELPYLRVTQALVRLRLPGKDTVLGDAFVEDMTRLLLAKGDEEHKIARAIWYRHDTLDTPRTTLRCKCGIWCEDVVYLFP
jgi:hypothetical protein